MSLFICFSICETYYTLSSSWGIRYEEEKMHKNSKYAACNRRNDRFWNEPSRNRDRTRLGRRSSHSQSLKAATPQRRKRKAEVSREKNRKTLQEYKYENKRLEMEAELLWDFLRLTGRK